MTKKHTLWLGDIVVSGWIPFDKVAWHYGWSTEMADARIAEDKANGLTHHHVELYCGHTPTCAADAVRRFLVIGVIPKIEGELKPMK